MRTAIIHDWLTVYAGAERALKEILDLFPDADLFATIDRVPPSQRHFLGDHRIYTSFLQRVPLIGRIYRQCLPLMPTAVERYDLSAYDLVISSSTAVAKGVLTAPHQLHICYLQARNLKYAYEDRLSYPAGGVKRLVEDLLLTWIRVWDSTASRRPDRTVANSEYVRRWHRHRHGIDAVVIYPPVDTTFFAGFSRETKEDYYVTVGRLEPYKRMDLVVQAFRDCPARRLVVVGDGTELATLRRMAPPNVEFAGFRPREQVAELVGRARAFVFAAREDFGIAPLEAQACGTPVIALADGGTRETIRDLVEPSPTGVLFAEQSRSAIVEALTRFEQDGHAITAAACQANAARFAPERFRREFRSYVDSALHDFHSTGGRPTGRSQERLVSRTSGPEDR